MTTTSCYFEKPFVGVQLLLMELFCHDDSLSASTSALASYADSGSHEGSIDDWAHSDGAKLLFFAGSESQSLCGV